jgi:phospholipase/carboxylesterase
MQRLPIALAKSSSKPTTHSLVPMSVVPHAASRRDGGAEWAWGEPSVATTTSAPAATFVPQGYEPSYAYPLLVWLHSDGSSEDSLPEVIRHVSLRNFVAVAPRGVVELEEGYGWQSNDVTIEEAEDAVFEAIDAVDSNLNINRRRIFLCGSGSGGRMAMRIAMASPDRFAGAATIDGPLPSGRPLLTRINQLRRLPLMLASSRQSAAYPESRVCKDLTLLHAAGCRVAVRQYPGDDDLTTAMLADLNRWAMEIVCG